MYIFNAFVTIPELANNAINTVARFGELSTVSATYSTDIRNFSDKLAFPGVELTSFAVLNSAMATIDLPDNTVPNRALSVAYFLYTQYINNAIPLPSSKSTLVSGIGSEFKDIRNISIGSIIDGEVTGKRLIDYIKFDIVVNTTQEWRVTLWFSDKSFKVQYPLYNIVVIPPVNDIDRLNSSPANAIEAIQSVGADYVVGRISAITKVNPDTTVQTLRLRWHDPAGTTASYDTIWTLVIYGAAGNDLDAIKDAIREYIASNSTSTKWPVIFPDLYSENEFLILPLWDKIATPTDGYDDGLYSSSTTISDINNQIDRVLPNSYKSTPQLQTFLERNLAVWGTSYRAINLLTVGNPNNKGKVTMLTQLYPDYMAVNTNNPDFSRMTTKTQQFILKLYAALELARNWTPDVLLNGNYAKVTKANREYVSFDYEGFSYCVITRMAYNKE